MCRKKASSNSERVPSPPIPLYSSSRTHAADGSSAATTSANAWLNAAFSAFASVASARSIREKISCHSVTRRASETYAFAASSAWVEPRSDASTIDETARTSGGGFFSFADARFSCRSPNDRSGAP